MASPNSYNFTITRDNLITDALLNIGALGEGEVPSANAIVSAARMLNMMVKLRASEGMPLWSVRRGTILPVTETSSINTNSHVVTEYVSTTLSSDTLSSATVLAVADSAGMAIADEIGIELDDDTMQYTTIVSVDSSTQITITIGLTGAAASGNRIYTYTASSDRIQRPVRIIVANILHVEDQVSWEITIEERDDYFALGSRTTEGVPNRIFYEPILGTRTASPDGAFYGTIYVYPRFSSGKYVVEFTYQEPMQDLDNATDNPYWPQEFYLPLMLELSALLSPQYGVSIEERRSLFAEAKLYREDALSTIYEEGSIFLQPENENA